MRRRAPRPLDPRRRRPGDRARPRGDRAGGRRARGEPRDTGCGAAARAGGAAGRRARRAAVGRHAGRTRTARPPSAPRSPPPWPPTAPSSRPSRRSATPVPPCARPWRVRYRNPTPAGLQVLLELQAGRLSDALAVRTALARAQEQAERDAGDAVAAVAAAVQARTAAEAARARSSPRRRAGGPAATAAAGGDRGGAELLFQVARLRSHRRRTPVRARRERARTGWPPRPPPAPRQARRAAPAVAGSPGRSRPQAPARLHVDRSGPGAERPAPGLVLCPLGTAPGHRLVPAAAPTTTR